MIGTVQTDLQAGSSHKYEVGSQLFFSLSILFFTYNSLYIPSHSTRMRTKHVIFFQLLWVLFFGFIFVLIIQSLAAKLGIITGETILTIKVGSANVSLLENFQMSKQVQ
jgi:hypothetical protein